MHYDPRRAEVTEIADRLALARRQRAHLDPGSPDDFDAYRVCSELAVELRQRRGLLGEMPDIAVIPRPRT